MSNDLLARYLHSVKFWLPKGQQQDILAELREDLESQVQDREESLGRPLTDDELVEIIRRRGAPMKVASAYVTEPRLIHPAMFATYRVVLKIVLLWILVPMFVLMFLRPALDTSRPALGIGTFLVEAFRTGFMAMGIITTLFIVFDRYYTKVKRIDDWDPRKLPRVPAPNQASDRANYFGGFVFNLGALVFWIYVGPHIHSFGWGDQVHVTLSPLFSQIYPAVLALTAADTAIDLYSFCSPASVLMRAGARLGLDGAAILIAAVLLKAGEWVALGIPTSSAQLAKMTYWANATIGITLICVIVIKGVDLIIQLRRFIKRKNTNSTQVLAVL